MKTAFTFFTSLIAWAFLCFASLAQAQTVITVVQQTCNIAQNACVLIGDGGQVITVNPSFFYVYDYPTPMTIDGVSYAGAVTSSVPVTIQPGLRIYDVTFTFVPTATLEAIHTSFVGRSGRGQSWHSSWQFQTVTLY